MTAGTQLHDRACSVVGSESGVNLGPEIDYRYDLFFAQIVKIGHRKVQVQVAMVRSANERSSKFYALLIVWCIAVVVLVRIELGVIAFVASVLLLIWVFGLRDKFNSETTASAYSVFNKDSQGITGGFTTAQLERQLRGGFRKNDATSSAPIPVLEQHSLDMPSSKSVGGDEKVRRRQAAAAAAERRLAPQSS